MNKTVQVTRRMEKSTRKTNNSNNKRIKVISNNKKIKVTSNNKRT